MHEYDELLAISMAVDWRFHVALVLAHETGHRIGAIRQLRWSDVSLEAEIVRWRGETEKTGYEHVTPLSETAKQALEVARSKDAGAGDAPILPAAKDVGRPVGRYVLRDLCKEAEKEAGLVPKRGRGWHSLRRKFATEMMAEPLSVVCRLGGWKDPETVLKCYQRPDDEDLRAALARRTGAPNRPQRTQRTDTKPRLRLIK